MRNVLAVCSLLLATMAAMAAQQQPAPIPDDPVFVQTLVSAPQVSAAEAKTYFDGRVAPAAAVATNRPETSPACEYRGGNERVRFMQRGPVRRAVAWLFGGRRRC